VNKTRNIWLSLLCGIFLVPITPRMMGSTVDGERTAGLVLLVSMGAAALGKPIYPAIVHWALGRLGVRARLAA
jgi:hypothetical protein